MGILLFSSATNAVYTAELAETVAIAESLEGAALYLSSAAETVPFAESLTSSAAFAATMAEAVPLTETITDVGPPSLPYPLERYSVSFETSNAVGSGSCGGCVTPNSTRAGLPATSSTAFTLSLTQGEDLVIEGTVSKNGSVVSLSGSQIFFTVKKSWRDEEPLISKRTVNAGGAVGEIALLPQLGETLGKFRIFLNDVDTNDLCQDEIDGAVWDWDCWLVTPNSEERPLVRRQALYVHPRVTVVP